MKKFENLERKRPAVMPKIVAEYKEDPTVRDRWGDPESRWFLTVDGKDYSELIPERDYLRIGTKGEYGDWSFDGEDEHYVTIETGSDEDEWIEENFEWLSAITTNRYILGWIYDAFQEAEWKDIY